jgi:hypothetical protein
MVATRVFPSAASTVRLRVAERRLPTVRAAMRRSSTKSLMRLPRRHDRCVVARDRSRLTAPLTAASTSRAEPIRASAPPPGLLDGRRMTVLPAPASLARVLALELVPHGAASRAGAVGFEVVAAGRDGDEFLERSGERIRVGATNSGDLVLTVGSSGPRH